MPSLLTNRTLVILNTVVVGILVEVVQPIIVLFEVPAAVSLHLLLQDLAVLAVVVARFFVCVVVLVVGADRS